MFSLVPPVTHSVNNRAECAVSFLHVPTVAQEGRVLTLQVDFTFKGSQTKKVGNQASPLIYYLTK